MFANCQLGGLNLAFPDVCLTPVPTPAGPVPVPIPYPNISAGPTGLPAAYNVLLSGGPAHNMATMEDLSQGDDTGIEGGILSHFDMGPTRTLLPSFTVLQDAMPATKLTSVTGQNGLLMNSVGMTCVPAQVTVLILS